MTHYYDPMFYLCSAEMPFTIRLETILKDPIDGEALTLAANQAIRRYPYFAVQLREENGELITVPNERPIIVFRGDKPCPLGGKEVNFHVQALSYVGSEINFYVSHVITDGCGYFPYVKTVLYYYLCRRYDTVLDPTGILLADAPFFPDELGDPYPEEAMRTAVPLSKPRKKEYFRLCDGGYVTDGRRTVFRFRVSEDEFQRFNYDNDGSPCSLVSSLMTKAIWSVHPDETRDIVSAVSFNMRPALGNEHSYRMVCSALPLRYPNTLRDAEISRLCTCSRGTVSLLREPDNVLYYAEQKRRSLEALLRLPDVRSKKERLGKEALADSVDNTFSVSYVGKTGLGSIEPYIEAMYNCTDGSTYKTAFLEINSINGMFYIALIQGFSSDVYYRAFLKQLEANGLSYEEMGVMPLGTPDMLLP